MGAGLKQKLYTAEVVLNTQLNTQTDTNAKAETTGAREQGQWRMRSLLKKRIGFRHISLVTGNDTDPNYV